MSAPHAPSVYLLYVDESGKSGLRDRRQPFLVLGGLAIHDSTWKLMEADLNARIDALVAPPRPHEWELHMTHMVNGKGWFRGMPRQTRSDLCDAVLDVLDAHKPTLIMIAIDKPALRAKYLYPGPPDEIAYRFMIERFDKFLARQADSIGVIVADEQKGTEDPIRRAHSSFRKTGTGYQIISNVIETPFFAPSHWSRMLQIVDTAAWLCNKMLRNRTERVGPPPQWARLKPRLDGYPHYTGRGLKVFP